MARKYNKKNQDYWTARKVGTTQQVNSAPQSFPVSQESIAFEWSGEEATAATPQQGPGGDSHKDSFAGGIYQTDRYRNINSYLLPWEFSNGMYSISRSILLCQKVYAAYAPARNVVDTLTEFSNLPLHIKTADDKVKALIHAWFNYFNINHVQDNYFREYYRSGSVFILKWLGQMAKDQFGRMQKMFGAKNNTVPIRFTILNPAQVYIQSGLGNQNNYVKALSTYEIESLRNPKNDADQQIFDSLPKDIQSSIIKGTGWRTLYIPLDPTRLRFSFYKKQDYEPLGTPMLYSVLDDIEDKLEMKKIDRTLVKMLDYAILVINYGHLADDKNPRSNPANLQNLQQIFRNQAVGRTLVGDHTLKAEWAVPDISSLMGEAKYAQIEKDINAALGFALLSGDKFANATLKAKALIERLQDGQKAFLADFLIPELKDFCKNMNIKDVPELEFEKVDITDKTAMARVYVLMAQLGLLTPDELNNALETGILPDKETMEKDQKEFALQRNQGMYYPMIGGQFDHDDTSGPQGGGMGGPPGSGGGGSGPKTVVPMGHASADYAFATKTILKILPQANELKANIQDHLMKKHKLTELTDEQIHLADLLAKSIIINEPQKKWDKSIATYINKPKFADDTIIDEIAKISLELDVDSWVATLLFKSKTEKPKN